MRRLSGFLLAAAIMVLPTFSPLGTAYAQEAQTFNGDTAILSYAINSDKTADYEEVMAKVRRGVAAVRQQPAQSAGSRVEGPQVRVADAGRQHCVHPPDQPRSQRCRLCDHGDSVRGV